MACAAGVYGGHETELAVRGTKRNSCSEALATVAICFCLRIPHFASILLVTTSALLKLRLFWGRREHIGDQTYATNAADHWMPL